MSSRFRVGGIAVLVMVIVVFAAGCGGSKNGSAEQAATPTASPRAEEREDSRTACKAPATTKATGLPAAFPIPGELTSSQVRKDGPTIVVDGYWTAGLGEALREYQDQVKQAGYTVLHKERDEHDAEINYKGSSRTGQIALRDNCSERATTRVHITNRPE
jgi:hypothetical protein